MLFWSHAILFLQEGFLDIMLAVAINLEFFSGEPLAWKSASLVFTNLLAIIMAGLCGFLTCFTICYLWPRFSKLRKKAFKKRFHPVYEMLYLRHGKWTMLWPVLFLVRRLVFVVAICALYNKIAFQILAFIVPTIVAMMVLALVKPL